MKNTSPRHRKPAAGFTLIELLVVIVIIAILAALSVPVYNTVMLKVQNLRTKAVMKDIQVAVGSYRTEYNRFPVDPTLIGGSDTDMQPFLTDENSDMIIILLAQNDPNVQPNLNSRKIRFIDLPLARNGLFGLVDPSGGQGDPGTPLRLVDTWGQPYTIALDTNQDNRVENPDIQNTELRISAQAPQFLPYSVIIYSYGPDRQPFTKDDVTSWR